MTIHTSHHLPIVVGIDVGGRRKGMHAVALREGRYLGKLATLDIAELVHWSVQEMDAVVIAIDAPCGWSTDGRCRPSERALMQQRIWCFATPTQAAARAHPTDHFGWMRYGMELYDALQASHPVRDPRSAVSGRYSFETFPHAITWYLRGGQANAQQKRRERRRLLEMHGIDAPAITNIDTVDAALCAYTAHLAHTGAPVVAFGEQATGLIVVPPMAAVGS